MKKDSLDYLLRRIKRGLSGYISYLAACDMNSSFSEYVLYEPILRILTAQKCDVKCEFICPNFPHKASGDKKKLDFSVTGKYTFALEVKWAKTRNISITSDYEKLRYYIRDRHPGFLVVFGPESAIENITFANKESFTEKGTPLIADFNQTKYGCRIYQLKPIYAL